MERRMMMALNRRENYIIARYDVADVSVATQLLDAVELFDLSQIKSMVVEGVEQSASRSYTFSTTGEKEVRYYMDSTAFTSMYCMFRGATALISVDLSGVDLSNCTSLACAFHSCVNLEECDLSGHDVSKVTSLAYMFWNGDDSVVSKLKSVSFNGCDFSAVTSMYGTFRGCHSLTDLNFIGLTTSSALTTLYACFNCCYSIGTLYLGRVDTTNVTNMSYMFGSCTSLTSVTFRTSVANVTNVSNMFKNVTTSGVLTYSSGYTFTKIINVLPSTWSAVAN